MKIVGKVLLYSALLLIARSALAEVNVNGYATIAFGMTADDDEVLYGYDNYVNYEENSSFGLQVTALLFDGVNGVVQLKSDGSKDWETNFEWAFVGYQFNDTFKFIFGRQRIPFYTYSDFVNVGYAYHWITPPEGVYNIPFDSIDGLSTLITNSVGDWDSTLQILFGRTRSTLNFQEGALSLVDETIELKDSLSVAWTLVNDWLTIRLAQTHADMSLTFQDVDLLAASWRDAATSASPLGAVLGDDFTAIVENMQQIPDEIQLTSDDAVFTNFGVVADREPFLFAAEWSNLDLGRSVFGEGESAYVSAGIRFNQSLLFHLTLGWDEGEGPEGILDGIPRNLTGGTSLGLDLWVNELLDITDEAIAANREETTTTTYGVRWDFHPSAAAKFELVRYDDEILDSDDATIVRFAISTVF